MSNTVAILHKLNALPPQLQDMVSMYIDFLTQQHPTNLPTQNKKRGGFGAWKGKIKMSEDFDAPLDELKDYM